MRAATLTCPGCGRAFKPHHLDQVYCEPRCGGAHRVRKHRQRKREEAEAALAEPPGQRRCIKCQKAILCSYNATDRCWPCGGWIVEIEDGPEADQQRAGDLIELMEAA